MAERLAAYVATAAIVLVTYGSAASSAPAPRLEWGKCPARAAAVSAAAMDCGWLVTDERLAGKTVRLRVVRLRARPDRVDPEPVVYVPGGPGSDAGLGPRGLAGWRAWQQRAGWQHDVVLFDPRATGQSRPKPSCDVIRKRRREAATRAPSSAREFDQEARAARACYRALGAGIATDLGPAAQLRDLDALVEALDVRRINLWAVSYGTRLARLYALHHPARVRAMALDSLFPFERNDLLAMPAQVGGALAQLDTWCRDHNACAADTSPPSSIVHALLRRYEQRAPGLRLSGSPARAAFRVTPYRLLLMVLFAGYRADNTADTIDRLVRARDGEPAALTPLAERLWRQASDADRNEAVFWSTRCAFGSAVPDSKAWADALAPYPALADTLAPARGAPICDFWNVPAMTPPDAGAPLHAPTLVVVGSADAVTPGTWAERFVQSHAHARLLRVAGAGHGASLGNACAACAIGRFWARPEKAALPNCDAAAVARDGD